MVPKTKRKPGARFDQPAERDLKITKLAGVLNGESVLVTNAEDIDALLHLGCYGKGVFSRSVPSHNKLPQLLDLRLRKKKSARVVQKSATASVAESSQLEDEVILCADPSVQEWLEKLDLYERSQHRRMKLHKEWSDEKQEPSTTRTTVELENLQADDSPQHASKTEEHPSTSEIAMDMTASSLPANQSMSIKKHYEGFVDRIKALTCDDPYPIPEPLQLSNVEALYLACELEVLSITQLNGTPVNGTELWEHYTSNNSSTIEKYTAYRYYRQKGWVPKSGLKFGVDFLLYKEGPIVYHSSYAVVVKLVDQVKLVSDSVTKPCNTGLTWKEVIALNRVSESVGKELIICYIARPTDTAAEEGGSVKLKSGLVEKYSVREVFVRRWVPDKERNTATKQT